MDGKVREVKDKLYLPLMKRFSLFFLGEGAVLRVKLRTSRLLGRPGAQEKILKKDSLTFFFFLNIPRFTIHLCILRSCNSKAYMVALGGDRTLGSCCKGQFLSFLDKCFGGTLTGWGLASDSYQEVSGRRENLAVVSLALFLSR
jgi:hypothetical protein